MKLETFLLIVFFIVVPLLERLNRTMQERKQRREDPPRAPPVPPSPASVPWPPEEAQDAIEGRRPAELPIPVQVALPRPPAPPPVPRRPMTERFPSRERARARAESQASPPRPVLVERAIHVARRGSLLARLQADRRHAIVLATILGPCRALDHDAGRG
jgi:hypothetical protein